MNSEVASPLVRAVRAYKQRAAGKLQQKQLEGALYLLKLVNQKLPKQNLLLASREEIKAAGLGALDELGIREKGGFLTAELKRFYDVALELGLINYHPLRQTARLRDAPAEIDETSPDLTQKAAEATAKLVAGIIRDSVQTGLMVSPLAGHLTSDGGQPPMLERLIRNLSRRWEALANRSRLLLSILQIAIPLVTFVLAVQAVFSPSNPMGGGFSRATDSGNTIRMLRVLVNEMDWGQEDLAEIHDLDELASRWGGPLGPGSEALRLVRVVPDAQALYLRNQDTGVLVIISPDLHGAFSRGRWRVRE